MGKKKKQEKLKKQKEKLKKQEKQEKLEKQEKAAKKAAKPGKEKPREKAVKTVRAGKSEKQAMPDKVKKPVTRQDAVSKTGRSEKRNAVGEGGTPKEKQVRKAYRAGTPSKQNRAAAARFRALGDENRLRILELLGDRELCAADILSSIDVVQSTLSHHMKTLTEAGLVNVRKQGKWSYYSLDAKLREQLSDLIGQWGWTADDKKQK